MRQTALLLLALGAAPSCGPAGFIPAEPPGFGGQDEGSDSFEDIEGARSDTGPKTERCGNAVDDDLDGQVDDGCACGPGQTQACWIGPRSARDQGICRSGQQRCGPDGDGGWAWGPCEDLLLPEPEDCADGEDDDCDGRPDCDDPDCAAACGGGCAAEELACRDGRDDDCDGAVDCEDPECAPSCAPDDDGASDDDGEPDDDGGGDCRDFESDCYDGWDEDCDGATDCADDDCACAGDDERCNGLDDDGDGRIDEGRACGQADDGGGECIPGALRICDAYCGVHQRCGDDGTWGACRVDALCEEVSSCAQHADCPRGDWCDFGWCVPGTADGWPCGEDWECGNGWCAFDQGVCVVDCFHHGDCGEGLVCDLGVCVADPYVAGSC